jgi:diguanylate cyclase (GGDEF)-like protein
MNLRGLWQKKLLSPSARISLGLVSLLVGLLLLLDLVLKLLPDHRSQSEHLRESLAIHLAVQVKRMMGDSLMRQQLQTVLTDIERQSDDIVSVGVRRMDGTLFVATSTHDNTWQRKTTDASTLTQVVVPLETTAGTWGYLEVGFEPPWPSTVKGWMMDSTVQLVLILSSSSFLAFYLYLRRILQHLDPSKAIPERVRVAFDALTEGLLVLDTQGRILLANSAFRSFKNESASILLGRSIEQLGWLVQGLKQEAGSEWPWQTVMRRSEPILGVPVDVENAPNEPRRALLNCAAIRDASGEARGVLVTLDDITALDRANAKLRATMSELETSRDQIKQQNEELKILANCDPMTGCLNRRAFYAKAEDYISHALNQGEPISCIMSDIDKFKNFNDTYGHAVGDLVIQQVSRLLKTNIRSNDLLCRYGGEEFCLLLPGCDLTKAGSVAESIRAAIERQAGPGIEEVPGLTITSSFGVAQLGVGGAQQLAQLIDRADQGLYAAKEAGRNQVKSLDQAPADAVGAH